MKFKRAILSRQSRRSFKKELPPIDKIRQIRDRVDEINDENNLNIQVMIDERDGFVGLTSHYGFFTNVKNYIALVGPKDDENIHEKLGYYGEQILLLCEDLGLGTCWVGGTFNKDKCKCKVSDDEIYSCAIVFGIPTNIVTPKEKLIRGTLHSLKKTKTIENLFYSEQTQPPNWFIEGMRMVQRAPSALNKMPVMFFFSDGNVYAKVKEPKTLELYDLGIAKFHFEVGAQCGKFEFGNGGTFVKDRD